MTPRIGANVTIRDSAGANLATLRGSRGVVHLLSHDDTLALIEFETGFVLRCWVPVRYLEPAAPYVVSEDDGTPDLPAAGGWE